MIAYNKTWLYNRYVRAQADQALQEQCIDPEIHGAIFKAKEVKFYTPNFFVRIGLAAVTLVIIVFATAFFGLMSGSAHPFLFLLIFIGAACYGAAELLISSKAHYNSGVDNMLVWVAALLVWAGISWAVSMEGRDISVVALSGIAFVLCLVLAIRFADSLLSIAGTLALLFFIFNSYQHIGALAKATSPFFMMLVSGVIYVISSKVIKRNPLLFYRSCLRCVSIVALVALYGAGNYYLVRELSNEMFHLNLMPGDALPMGWFFWSWTVLLPFIYIAAGVRNNNTTIIRVGIPLIAVAVLTFRYYHSVLAPELAMMLGGGLLLIVSWSLINYLRIPKNGFTFKPESYAKDTPDMGALVSKEFIDKATGR